MRHFLVASDSKPRITVVALTVLALLTGFFVNVADSTEAQAANAADFNPGNIISDSVFFNGNAMSTSEVQSFLNARTCWINNGNPKYSSGTYIPEHNSYVASDCLKGYRVDTPNLRGDSLCAAYSGVVGESAASIIARVGQACGISQKVLLVLLEKEQSLVSDPWPNVRQYATATGFNCPDTAPCSEASKGFFSQLYAAARQFKNYAANPNYTGWNYFAGRVNDILYNPNRACGTKPVFIENQATRALYIYTPYTPNQAALNNLYGLGDSCSAYGNRNFWRLFTDWFGSSRGIEVTGAIKAHFDSIGGTSSYLGLPTTNEDCNLVRNGCYQAFSGGFIFHSATGTHNVSSLIRRGWSAAGNERGVLGYPISSTMTGLVAGGSWQRFEGGLVFSSEAGTFFVLPNIRSGWEQYGNENGFLGYPISNSMSGLRDGGSWQIFQGGFVFQSASTGAHPVKPEVRALWNRYGNENGLLGYPTSGPSNSTTTYTQTFQGGTVTVTNGIAQITATTDPWLSTVLNNTWLRDPVSQKMSGLRDGGSWQIFQGGFVFQSASTGAHPVKPEVRALWNRYGNENGLLGYPTSGPSNSTTTYTQTFQGGTVTVTNGIAQITATTDPWLSTVLNNTWLRDPVSQKMSGLRDGGSWQIFQGGFVFQSASTGAHPVKPEVRALWNRYGNENGLLGYPTSGPSNSTTTYTQTFQGGTVTVTNGIAQITATTDPWLSTVLNNTWLRDPVSQKMSGLRDGGSWQIFQGGFVFQSASTGAHPVKPEVRALWNRYGNENGLLGYPTSGPSNSTTTYTQTFQGGTVTVTNGIAQITATTDPWLSTVLNNTWLRDPVSQKMSGLRDGGSWQIFQGGFVFQSASTGAHPVKPEVRALWNRYGNENGLLGYPTSGPSNSTTTYTQTFQGGTVTVTNGIAQLN